MRFGHAASLLGAGLVVVGALVLPWMDFELADIAAPGALVPSAQILAVLAMLGVGTAAIGLRGRRPRVFATANLFVAVCAVAWAAIAYATRAAWFEMAPDEVVSMASGFSVAGWGITLMLGGSLVSLATRLPMTHRSDAMVVEVCEGITAVMEVVNPDDTASRPRRLGWLAVDTPMAAALVASVFGQVLFAALIFSAGVQ